MGSVIPAGFGQAVMEFDFITGPSNPMAMVFGYENASDQSPNGNAAIIRDEYVSNVLNTDLIGNNVQLLRVNVVQNPGGASASAASGEAGNNGDPTLPPQVAYLIRKQSASGGRTGRGRFYQPGPPVGATAEGGTVDSTIRGQLEEAFNDWNFNLDSNSIPMVILHAEPSLLAPVLVTNLDVDVLLATQRRRLRG